jgi:hypothetical protein
MKKTIIISVWLIAAAVWAGIIALKIIGDPSLAQWTIAVTAGALSIEAAVWVTAGVLGISLLQGRKTVLRFLTAPFRRKGS